METTFDKNNTTELIKYLASNPTEIPTYINYLIKGTKSLDGLPWIALGAINLIEEYLKPGMSVFEYGAGNSTIYFSKHEVHLHGAENNTEWFGQVHRLLANTEHKMLSFDLRLYPYDPSNTQAFLDSGYSESIRKALKLFDVVLIDGQEIDNYLARPRCFYQAEHFIKQGGLIVVDDFWRYPQLLKKHNALKVDVIEGIGPGRRGLTSTAIFHY